MLGILVLSQEFRFGTVPRRSWPHPTGSECCWRRIAAVSLAGLTFAVASVPLVLGLAAVVIGARGRSVVWDRDVLETVGGVVVVLAACGPLGLAIAALVRNQIAAIVGSVAWLFVAEGLLIALLPSIGRWTPGGAIAAALQLGRIATTRGSLLPAWAGSLVLLAYTAAFLFVGGRLLARRDITGST